MKLNAYTIFDSASGLYNRPIFTNSDGEAKRTFVDIATDADHPIGKHPEDYSLHRIGIFDDNNAELIPEKNECLITALEAVSLARKGNGQQSFPFQTSIDPTDQKPGLTD